MASEVNQALQAVTEANNKFTFALYQILAEKSGNLFFSPISVQVILALAHLGAKGPTAQEIKTGLHLPNDNKVIEEGFNLLMSELKGSDDMILEMANKIYSQATFPLKEEFKISATKFIAEAQELDFINESEKSRITINRWVEEMTREKIKDLIPSGAINNLTRLILVNAIYFKGKWSIRFKEADTSPMDFHLSLTEKKRVDMMHLKKKFMYAEIAELNAQVLELPYKGDQTSMLIFLPWKVDGLQDLEKKLATVNITELVKQMRKCEVKVSFPKFRMEHSIDLGDYLQRLGMKTMFDEGKADFSGISEARPGLKVSKVFHKAFIEVNEEGTEAAAATGMVLMKRCAPRPPVDFIVDRPFLFLLMETVHNSFMFMGRVQSL